jgi:hypothetical protein
MGLDASLLADLRGGAVSPVGAGSRDQDRSQRIAAPAPMALRVGMFSVSVRPSARPAAQAWHYDRACLTQYPVCPH